MSLRPLSVRYSENINAGSVGLERIYVLEALILLI